MTPSGSDMSSRDLVPISPGSSGRSDGTMEAFVGLVELEASAVSRPVEVEGIQGEGPSWDGGVRHRRLAVMPRVGSQQGM
jgi:hypothetical protein